MARRIYIKDGGLGSNPIPNGYTALGSYNGQLEKKVGDVISSTAPTGATGSPGIDGTDGSPGIDGTDGSPGIDGTDGSPGIDGIDGITGATGSQGITGATGSQGITGATGSIPIDFIWNNFMINETSWFLPGNGNAIYNELRTRTSGNILGFSAGGSVANGGIFPDCIQYTTSGAASGAIVSQYGNPIDVNPSLLYDFTYQRRFKIMINISVQRFFAGLSVKYSSTQPTNIDLSTMINSIGVCKTDTSNNMFFCYNDATGTASLVDCGSNFPATNAYAYTLTIQKVRSNPQITVTLTRLNISTGATLDTVANITTGDYNNTTHYPVIWITNNSTTTGARFNDFGCIIQKSSIY